MRGQFLGWLPVARLVRQWPQMAADGRRSNWMKQPIGPDRLDGPDQRQAAMKTEPGACVAMPLDIEAVAADPVEAREGSVELLAEVFRVAGPIALDKPILGAVPFTEDIDRVVEFCRPDCGQKSWLQEFID